MSDKVQLPANVHVSNHPCLQAKLSQLRSKDATPREVKALVHEISLILGCNALGQALTVAPGPAGETPLGFQYQTTTITPANISIIPILRSGLEMVDPIQTILPIEQVPVHHLGLYREPTTLLPVEYYNNLTEHKPSASDLAGAGSSSSSGSSSNNRIAILLDPVIATGGTCAAAIQTLREWGVARIVVLSILGALPGVVRAASEWPEGTDIWLAGLDRDLTDAGMISPGVGDIGDRLFKTIGK